MTGLRLENRPGFDRFNATLQMLGWYQTTLLRVVQVFSVAYYFDSGRCLEAARPVIALFRWLSSS
jgi:hypothetical protein